LITCKSCADRLPNATKALRIISNDFQLVTPWDADSIDPQDFMDSINHESNWEKALQVLKTILVANTLTAQTPDYGQALKLADNILSTSPNLSWMHHRPLANGEISVLLKHYYALSSISVSSSSWGLIAEDDITSKDDTFDIFNKCIDEFLNADADYLDLAGGCGLSPDIYDCGVHTQPVIPPRTRTNACYVVSNRLAKYLVESFWPLIFPIDWHLQFLLLSGSHWKCRWAVDPPYLHGSEHGQYQSWRNNV